MKKIIIINKILAFVFTAVLISSCGSKSEEATKEEHHDEEASIVELTPEQVKIINLKLGKIEMKDLSGAIKVNGMLDVPPQNLVSISAPMGGFVKSTELLQGMKVTKGQAIVVMQHPDYIQMQQDFLETKSQLEYLEAEYKRQQELSKDNVNSQKTLQLAKSQYEGMLAKNAGLKSKLMMLGINGEKLTSQTMQNSITITSPISGYVTSVNVNIGMYVNPTDVMFKIVDTEHLHAELTVFEKDVPKIKLGQKVRFTLANETDERTATVYLIGREISSDRTVRIHCHLDKEDLDLLPGMYLKAYVEAGTQRLSALPNEAIVNFEGKDYVFVTEKEANHFKMLEVTKGISELGYTEIVTKEGLNNESLIVINGAYDILAKIKNSEEEGGHGH
ncbi:MAG: efflux RND transporter periplasmic adaptor subunit [Bacteroidetes bacterium]|nr:efflux RND transporter periplasmic adaptor subunit [Bacteroidota bacterium]